MPKAKTKPDVRVFNTADVVALYLGKVFDRKSMPEIRNIVEFLVGGGDSFFYSDTDKHNKVCQILFKQHQWLGSVHYNRERITEMVANLVHNHGGSLKLGKPTPSLLRLSCPRWVGRLICFPDFPSVGYYFPTF